MSNCLTCNKEFISIRSGHGGTRYCSRKCGYKANRLKLKTCYFCKKDFRPDSSERIYCSLLCSNHREVSYYTIKCYFCKKEIKTLKRNQQYCSYKCQQGLKFKEALDQTLKENKFLYKHTSSSRRLAFAIFGKSCSICKGVEWMGKEIPLVLDHIDGNSDDWSLNNLRLICANCDCQTPTYKGRNRGKGRYSRRQRYVQEKKRLEVYLK